MKKIATIILVFSLIIAFCGCNNKPQIVAHNNINPDEIPAYTASPYVELNGNKPWFTESDYTTKSFEAYSELDNLGRCGPAIASVGRDIMPTDDRSNIDHIKPSGWQYAKYDWVDGKYLFNRCHLIGFQLTGENANEKNLITGTRYMNNEGMLPFENMVADYVKDTGNHVLLRVTPVFSGDNLVADGITMEAYSVEDNGNGICFNIFCYNVQPGVIIDYANGESRAENADETPSQYNEKKASYILNTNTKKIHLPSCSDASNIKEKNKSEFYGYLSDAIKKGYTPCGSCNPQ